MDLRRLRKGEWISAVAGVVLLASLALPWYSVEFSRGQIDPDQPNHLESSAWDLFSVTDLVLAFSALAAIGIWVLVANARTPSTGIAAEALATIYCGGAAIAAVIRLLALPGVGSLPDGVDAPTVSWELGAYLGVAAAIAVPVGLVIAMRDERRSTPGRLTDSTGVPVDAAPEPEHVDLPRT